MGVQFWERRLKRSMPSLTGGWVAGVARRGEAAAAGMELMAVHWFLRS